MTQLKAFAQPQDLKFKNYELNGLENRNSLVRDSSGYIWLTGNGAARFDGNQLKIYRRNDNIPNSLPGDDTRNLIVDKNGTVWLECGDLCYYNRTLDGFGYITIPGEKNKSLGCVVYDGKETIWFCCDLGLCNININTKKVTTTSLKDYRYPNQAVIDNSGKVWLCSWRGCIAVYTPADDSFKKFYIYDHANVMTLTSIFITKQNKLWVAKNEGVLEIDPQHLTDKYGKLNFEEISSLQHVTVSVWIRPMQYLSAYTGDSILWIATESHGLITLNVNTRQIAATYLPDKGNPNSIASNTPRSLYVDKDNHLWITQSNGITLLNPDNQNFKSRILTELDQQYARLISLEHDKKEKDVVWMGTNYGLIKYDWAQKKILKYIKSWGKFQASNANAISNDDDGNIWIGSGNTLYTYQKSSGIFTQYPPLPADTKLSYEPIINKIVSLHDTILIASGAGLIEYLVKQKKYKTLYTGLDEGLDNNSFNLSSIKPDAEGIVWCTGYKGLLKFNLTTNQHQLYLFDDKKDFNRFNRLNGFDFDRDTCMLAASAGIVMFNKSTKQFKKLAPANDVQLNNSWNVIEDSLHNLWISTYYGLVFYNRIRRTHKTFTVNDGLPRSFTNTWLDFIDNTVVFKWRNKFAYIDPYSVEKNTSIPQPVITSFNILDKPVLFDAASVARTSYNLSYQQNFITFDFNAFEFNYPDKIQFQYRLNGFDEDWIESDKKNATYTNLPNGNFTFEIKAANSEGLWSKPVVFKIYIKAAFWQTPWFKILIALILGITIYWIVRNRIKKIRMEEETKTQTNRLMAEAEMKALRSQMNPHFIFNSLNSIQKFIWENKPEDTAEYLNKFSRLMRMILDNSMQKWVTLEQELNTVTLYIELEHRRSNNKFDYHIIVNDKLDTTTLLVPPMILQPYAENAIWHGLLPKDGRGDLRISIMPGSNENVECIIEDNGIGRNAESNGTAKNESKRISHGMQLTRQRIIMSESNGKHGDVVVEDLKKDNKSFGTRVNIHLPVNSFIKI